MMEHDEQVFLGRQPILDRQQNLHAFELLFRATEANHAVVTDGRHASASVILRAFSDFGVEAALGAYKGFINVDADLLLSEAIELLPRDKIVLEILETVDITPEIQQRCAQLKQLGFMLALDDVGENSEAYRLLFKLIDIVKVDLTLHNSAGLPEVTRQLKHPKIKLLAEKVEAREQFEQCFALGYDLFQGYYFAKPQVISGRRLSQSELVLIRLMGLVLGDADGGEIEAVLKQHPGLSFNLLRMANSVASGLTREIRSLKDAITLIGRRQLQRWLLLLMFAGSSRTEKLASPLLQLAATRGRLMELVAGHCGKDREFEDQAFLTGIMSLMDALFNMPLTDIIADLNIAQNVRAALLEHSGLLGSLLEFAEALERNDTERAAALVMPIQGLGVYELNAAHAEALRWANAVAA